MVPSRQILSLNKLRIIKSYYLMYTAIWSELQFSNAVLCSLKSQGLLIQCSPVPFMIEAWGF